jgi:Raf kinase inhibitor-like YbhB/YbcL family protein
MGGKKRLILYRCYHDSGEKFMRYLFILLSSFFIFSSNVLALTLSSPAFVNGDTLPAQFSCDGKNISPVLTWSNVSAHTQSFALIFSDKDAPGGLFYHWVVFNIPKATTTLAQAVNKLPTGALLGVNTWREAQYRGPCPPKGTTHHYVFSLYALDTRLTLPVGSDAPSILEAIKNHIINTAELKVMFGH